MLNDVKLDYQKILNVYCAEYDTRLKLVCCWTPEVNIVKSGIHLLSL